MKVKILVQMHPKAKEGFFEASRTSSRAEFVLSSQSALSTEEAVAMGDVVVCYNSTVGFQALSLGKKSIFVTAENDPYTNLAIEKKLSKKVCSPDMFYSILKDGDKTSSSFYQALGVPKKSTDEMLSLIHELMSRTYLGTPQ